MPIGIKIYKLKPFNSSTEDPNVLDSFIYAHELHFKLTKLTLPSQKALIALLWLDGEVAIWWQ